MTVSDMAESPTQRKTHSACCATSAGVAQALPPASAASFLAFPSECDQSATSCPALRRLRAMGAPISPSPRNPSFAIKEDCTCLILNPRKNMSVESLFLRCSVDKLKELTGRIEFCLGSLNDEQLWARGRQSENAIGNLALHLAGNVRQWIIASLGNNPDERDRDAEFDALGGHTTVELSVKLRGTVEQ